MNPTISLAGARLTGGDAVARADAVSKTLATLKIGAVLQAAVVTAAGDGRPLQLAVAGRILNAATELTLKPGDDLRLKVVQEGARPVLRVLTVARPVSTTGLRAQALRVALARQSPILPAIELLQDASIQALKGESSGAVRGPPITAALARAAALTEPAMLRDTIRASGLFLEARLAALAARPPTPSSLMTGNFARDLKASLLRALSSLALPNEPPAAPRNTTHMNQTRNFAPNGANASTADAGAAQNGIHSATRHAIEGALARITAHQLQALPDPASVSGQVLNVELPILRDGHVEPLLLRIRRGDQDSESPSEPRDAQRWEVEITTEIAPIGPIHCRIGLYQQRVTVNLWAEQQDTHALFASQLGELSDALHADGLAVHAVQCRHGTPPKRASRTPSDLFVARA